MDIEKIVNEMRTLGESLAGFSFPQVSGEDEDEISPLKTRDVVVDGYAVTVHFSRAVYEDHILETFQCLGQKSPFVPFTVVAKLARKFLGDRHLCFVDVFLNNKKVYCWTLTKDLDGKPLATQQRVLKTMEWDGLNFSYLHPSAVNFF